MRIDKFGNPIYNEKDLLELIYQKKLDLIDKVYCESYVHLNGYNIKNIPEYAYELSIEEFDNICKAEWFLPAEYKDFDIENWIYNKIPPWDENNIRITEELDEFKNRNMMDILRWLKYMVDICREKNIVWGVGRGSSVSSYVLYLIGVHKIDPIKYNLDWKDFLR
ncbi:MAG: hypothetical protein EBT86_05130 [Actinobacteria bacterium]|nr:hypothetical protein [Actinomycetota bacterium]